MSLEYSDIPPHKSRTVSPCFCCDMKKSNFYVMANSSLFIVSCGLLIFALFLLFELNIVFAALGLLIVASFHLIIALVSFLKYYKYHTIGTRFHKWQAIGNIIFALIMFILFTCAVIFLLIITLKSNLSDSEVWNNLLYKYIILIATFPLLVFYTYWSLLFMRIVSEKRQTYLSNTVSDPKIDSESQRESSEVDPSIKENKSR